MLRGTCGQTWGAPASAACAVSVTAGSGSQSMSIASAASLARSMLSANTAATASPTKRAHARVSTRYGGSKLGAPSGAVRFTRELKLPRPATSASSPVSTRCTPGMASAAAVSMRRMRAAACGERIT